MLNADMEVASVVSENEHRNKDAFIVDADEAIVGSEKKHWNEEIAVMTCTESFCCLAGRDIPIDRLKSDEISGRELEILLCRKGSCTTRREAHRLD